MNRLEDWTAFLKSGSAAGALGLEDLNKLHMELKKFSANDLDSALRGMDASKHSQYITVVLGAKAASPTCEIDKTLQQVETFLVGIGTATPRNVDGHQVYQLFRHIMDRLIHDKVPYLGFELFQLAINTVRNHAKQLTEIHWLFVHLCLNSNNLKPAIEFLEPEICEVVPQKIFELDALLLYFYYGSVVLASYKYFVSALSCIETIFFFPGASGSDSRVIIDAYKKYILLSVLAKERVSSLPRGVSGYLEAHMKKFVAPYLAFQEQFLAETYNFVALEAVVAIHGGVFIQDHNAGLVKHCLKRYKTKELLKFAKVYENIDLTTAVQHIGLPDLDALESHLIDMYSYGDRIGRLDLSKRIIVFSKKTDSISTEQVIYSLQTSLTEMQVVLDTMWKVERQILSEPEFLKKAASAERGMSITDDYFGDAIASSGNGGFGGFPMRF